MKNIINSRSEIFQIWVVIIPAISNFAFPPTGGPERIKILGYNYKERKVYFTTLFLGGTDRIPEISYIEFSSGTPSKPVVDESWYSENEKVTRLLYGKHLKSLRSKISHFRRINQIP